MQKVALVFSCLVCAGQGRRVQQTSAPAQESAPSVHQSSRRPSNADSDPTLQALAKLLSVSKSGRAAFKSGPGPRPPHESPTLAKPRRSLEEPAAQPTAFFDPLNLHSRDEVPGSVGMLGASALALLGGSAAAWAAQPLSLESVRKEFDPATFQPVCPASDGFYRLAQNVVVATIGPDDYKTYAPLVAEGLLRVRLELCVLESYFIEAIVPFIRRNGLSWVLPVHESVETFLAGVIFAIATSFILIGSTKILTVLATGFDILGGLPFRFVGGFGWRNLEDKALEIKAQELKEAGIEEKERPWWRGPKPRESPPLEDVIEANNGSPEEKAKLAFWGGLLGIGLVSKTLREIVERIDSFAGRELYLLTVFYVAIKFIHFKVWDPFP